MHERTVWLLFVAGLLMYAMMRLYRIEDFPIYFFTDEAVHMVQFRAMMENGWHSTEIPREFLPAYFVNGGMFNLSLSVYVQGIAGLLFGQTVETVRITSVLFSLTGAVALALMLRKVFRIREWWVVVPILAVLPCWFLHSRTGFETVLMVTAYSWFLYFYSRYRAGEPRWVVGAMLSGAAVFYAYAPGQGIMFMTGLLLLVSDGRYHWQNRKWFLAGAALALVLFVPYLRFRWLHPEMLSGHLAILESYWVKPIPLTEKLVIFLNNYLSCISPRYWFFAETDIAIRHLVPGHAHIPFWLAPFALGGMAVCVYKWRDPAHRMILLVFLATPFSSALVSPMVTRLLAVTVPFALCAALGFGFLMDRFAGRWLVSLRVFVLVGLSLAGAFLVRDALRKPRAKGIDYGLYGYQWGAQAVYRDLIPVYLQTDPAANIIITHITYNSPEVFPAFFGWMNQNRVIFASLADIETGETLPEPKDLVLLSNAEFLRLENNPKITAVTKRAEVKLPDGNPGFYLVQLDLDAGFVAATRKARGHGIRPMSDRALLNGVPVSFALTGAESGRAEDLAKGLEITSEAGKPINLQMFFDVSLRFRSVEVHSRKGAVSRISIWGFKRGQLVNSRVGYWGESPVALIAAGDFYDSVRIELTGGPGLVNTLTKVVLIPEAGKAEQP